MKYRRDGSGKIAEELVRLSIHPYLLEELFAREAAAPVNPARFLPVSVHRQQRYESRHLKNQHKHKPRPAHNLNREFIHHSKVFKTNIRPSQKAKPG